MSKVAIKNLVNVIEALPDEDRLELERELNRRFEKKWEVETKKAQRIARRRGITQSTIDRIIEQLRYG